MPRPVTVIPITEPPVPPVAEKIGARVEDEGSIHSVQVALTANDSYVDLLAYGGLGIGCRLDESERQPQQGARMTGAAAIALGEELIALGRRSRTR